MSAPEVASEVDLQPVSSELAPLLIAVYEELRPNPVSRAAVKATLLSLIQFLASPQGRTHANVSATDNFFCIVDDWEFETDHVPDDIRTILADLGGGLHDTVETPHIAEAFDCTPEQLLPRVQALKG